MSIDNDYLLIEKYKSLQGQIKSQGDRIWIRFNYFLTIDAALIGIFIMKLAENGESELLYNVPFLGIGLSLLWYIIGAQDYYFFEKARKTLQYFEKVNIHSRIDLPNFDQVMKVRWYKRLFCWKIPKYGVTIFIAICPALFIITWILLNIVLF